MLIEDITRQAGELFVLPDTVTRLKTCMDDSASSMDDVAEIIAYDPALTSQLLKVANSAMYRFPNRIDTVSRAVQVIGTRSTYDLALAYGVSHAFSDIDPKVIDLDKFWELSVSCGLLAKYFAEIRHIRQPERLFVGGLLHNIGELIMVGVAPSLAIQCGNFSLSQSPAVLQQNLLGFTYADLSAALIKQWNIPESIYMPIARIHDTDINALNQFDWVLKLAYSLSLDNIHADVYPSYHHVNKEVVSKLELDKDALEDALDITNLQCLSVIQLFNPSAFVLY